MADSFQMADRQAIRMGMVSGLITGLGCELDEAGESWLVSAVREGGHSRWLLCDEIPEGDSSVLRPARFPDPREALDAAARLVPRADRGETEPP